MNKTSFCTGSSAAAAPLPGISMSLWEEKPKSHTNYTARDNCKCVKASKCSACRFGFCLGNLSAEMGCVGGWDEDGTESHSASELIGVTGVFWRAPGNGSQSGWTTGWIESGSGAQTQTSLLHPCLVAEYAGAELICWQCSALPYNHFQGCFAAT